MRHKKRKFKINGYVLFSALILIVLVFIQTFLLTQPKMMILRRHRLKIQLQKKIPRPS